jgi:gliding motility-associated-like protein
MKKNYILFLVLIVAPIFSFATHIVGGSLTYVYNGGSNYTITLKLYRDCGAGTASLPGSVSISILGNNGVPFSPSKDVTINLGTVTNVPSNLSPCAIAPNPLPCVQEAVYTTTVNNLPPNPGGYHLYYQIVARNLSLTNVNAACSCVGESFYAHIPGPNETSIWNENFALPNGTTVDNGTTAWSTLTGSIPPNSAMVNSNMFEIKGANNAQYTWSSQNINISSCNSVGVTVNLSELGNLDPNDSALVYYKLNGGPLTLFPVNGFKAANFTSTMASVSGLVGNTLQIIIRIRFDGNSPNSEIYQIDNVNVNCSTGAFLANSNPVFNLFPPLFICVNQPFTFNHAATDSDGDSLSYSFYTPYNGDNGVGPLDPTFPSNTASFIPITFLGGYSATSPLGTPLTLNATTGLLTGTPTIQGQFVVGIMVKEYRNGIYLGQTLRDFQFNVLSCPQTPPAITVTDISINNGCVKPLVASGITSASTTWHSIYPGVSGAYNNYLSCTSGCLTPTVTVIGTPPPYIDYIVCGNSISCAGTYVCDTVRVNFNQTLAVSILPSNPTLCFGQTSTTLTAIGSGGTPPYSYLWNNVNAVQNIFVGVGTYNVKVTDASGCPPAYNSIVVTSYSVPISANAGADKTVCVQNPMATINAMVVGAVGGIWSGGNGTFSPNNITLTNLNYTPSASELATGSATLFLTTTGNGNCPLDVDTLVIHYSNFTATATTSANAISCYGGINGSASLNLTGGIGPFVYSWTTVPTQTTPSVNNLALGIYSISVTDGIGCNYQTTVTITQPTPLNVVFTSTNVSCQGVANGIIQTVVTGGTSPYGYSWLNNGQTGSGLNNISAGIYTLVVTDAKGCSLTKTVTITEPTLLNVALTTTNVSCFSGTTGIINSTVSGGTSGYTYSWSPTGSSAANLNNVVASNYTLIVTDSKGCVSSKTTTITQPTPLLAAISVTNETCNYLNNGIAVVSASGGTAGYTYLWQSGSQTTNTINNLSSGVYSVTVTDVKGCTTTTIATISEPTVLGVSISNQINVSCFGGSNGTASASGTGGTPNYSYTWSPVGSTNAMLTGMSAGTYTVLVSDNKSCQTQTTVTITQPTPLNVVFTSTNISCQGGANGIIQTSVTGGTSPYTYSWLNNGQTGSGLNNISAGTYTLVATDAKGCSLTKIVTITEPTLLNVTLTTTNVNCFNGTTGIINSTVSGGTSGYTYSWSPSGSTGTNLNNTVAGNYTLTVTDAKGCVSSKTTTITQPTPLLAAISVTNETCNYLNNGIAVVSASGGTAGYTYLWQSGSQTTNTINNLSSGVYSVTVTDVKGCTTTTIATISEPTVLGVSISNQINVSCFGGSNGTASASGTGGTPNYSYTWSPVGSTNAMLTGMSAGTYTVLVSDNKSCQTQTTVTITQPTPLNVVFTSTNISCQGGANGIIQTSVTGGTSPYTYSWLNNGQTGSGLNNISAGTYTLVATDAKGCSLTKIVTITEPTLLNVTLTTTNVNCFNGTTGIINSTVSGGTSGYTYSWSPSGSTGTNLNNTVAGNYTLTVTDAKGCVSSKTTTITQPTPLLAAISVTNETCNYLNNGIASVSASGGTSGYTYLWQPGLQTTNTINNLSSGGYSVTVTDVKGCTMTTIATISEPTVLGVSISNQINVSCFGGTNGTASASGTGGTPNYSYTWSPGGSTNAMLTGMSAGTYTVLVSDSKSCQAQTTVTITQPNILNVSTGITNVACNGGNSGAISISPSGGTAPYIHTLFPGNIVSSNFSSLSPGTYTIITLDGNNCGNTTTVNINQPINISAAISFTNSNCGVQNGMASISITSGGVAPFTYQWLPSGGTNSVSTNLFAGSYTVNVFDNNGCLASNIININDIEGPTVSILSTTNVSCFGGSNGSAIATYTGGTGPGYTYTWLPSGGNSLTTTGLTIGSYVIKITDNSGCIGLATTSLITQPTLITTAITSTAVSCFGGSNGSAQATVNGGTPGYSYQWLPSGTTASTISGLASGNYTLQVKDSYSCTQTSTFAIAQPTSAVSSSIVSNSVSCFGGSNGSSTVTALGGTSPYSYLWSYGSVSGNVLSNVPAGNYSVTITDFQGCNTTATVTIIEPTILSLSMGSVNSNCSLANGQASVTASGGVGSYQYLWTPSGNTNQITTGLLAGTYSVSVQDGNGCQATNSVTVLDNPSPTASVSAIGNVTCYGGSNGTATVSVTGGTAPFTYSWSPVGGTSSVGSNLTIGTYTVQVSSSNGCSVSAISSLITQPTPVITSITNTAVSCFGGSNGSAQATVNGGTPGYSYQWLPSGTTASTISGLASGNYTLQVKDSYSCTQTSTFAIAQPTSAVSSSIASSSVSCFGGSNGSSTVTASGGTTPYSYLWNYGNVSGNVLSNVPSGNYSVTITDFKSCNTTATVTIIEPTMLSLSMSSINSNCSLANGQASVTASGGVGSYQYLWTSGGNTNQISTGLLAGNYSVSVHDGNNCSATNSVVVLDNPSPTASVSAIGNVTCYGGSNGTATVSVVGGTGPFTYSWSPIGGTSAVGNNLTIGTYTVQVSSSNGCTVSAVSSLITEPLPLITSITSTAVSCFGGSNGSAQATVSGGTPGYTYQWLPSGTIANTIAGLTSGNYTLQVKDSYSCTQTSTFAITQPILLTVNVSSLTNVSCFNGNNGSGTVSVNGGTAPMNYNWIPYGGNGAIASGLSNGSYSVMITDINGCNTTTSLSITQPSLALSATGFGNATLCFGSSNGTASVSVVGGTQNYTYQWSPLGGSSNIATGLPNGNYFVTINDLNNCQTIVPISVAQAIPITGTLIPNNASCGLPNGFITSQINGGTGPYAYSWNSGLSNTVNLTNIAGGSYSLQITDNNNCVSTFSTSIINLPVPSIGITSTNSVSCYGVNNGIATATINNVALPYNMNWLPSGGNALSATNLTVGNYTAQLTDANGCLVSANVTINEPSLLSISSVSVTDVLCYGQNSGAVTIQAIGGSSVYSYSWSANNASTSTVANLSSGNYTVWVTDNNNCNASTSVFVNQPTALITTITGISNSICYNTTGSSTVNVSGGTMPYTYYWSSVPSQSGSIASNLVAGNYTFQATDAKGCTASNTIAITEPSQIITSVGVNDTICVGQQATISSTAIGGLGNYYYTWMPSGAINTGTLNSSPLSNTTYTVVAFDQNGCAGIDDQVKVIVYNLANANVQVVGQTPICPGQASLISAQVFGNTGPVSLSWNNGLGNGTGPYIVHPAQPTTYALTVNSSCGITIKDSVIVLLNPQPTLVFSSDTINSCAPGIINFTDNSIAGNTADPITSWNWNFGDGTVSTSENPSHIYNSSGTFTVNLTVTTDAGCTSNSSLNPIIIHTFPTPIASFSVNSTSLDLPYDVLHCTNLSSGATSYVWDFGDATGSTITDPNHLYQTIGQFQIQLVAVNQYGCKDTATSEVVTHADVVFPNAFTPNSDGSSGGAYNVASLDNDVFFPYTSGVVDFKLQIFDRWGELIFESTDIKTCWDGYYKGKLCQLGVYIWKAYVKLNNGKEFNKTGDVTLLR